MKNISLKNAVLFLIFLAFLSANKCSNDFSYDDLEELLERANLVFYEPSEYTLTPAISNNQCHYDFAYILRNGIEVRYTVMPYNKEFNETEEGCAIFFSTFVFNISKKGSDIRGRQQKLFESIKLFPTEAVHSDFNADFGAYAWCDLDTEFGQDYKRCNIFVIHKANCGMVVCYWLFKDEEHEKQYLLEQSDYVQFFNSMQFFKSKPPMMEHPKGISRIVYSKKQ